MRTCCISATVFSKETEVMKIHCAHCELSPGMRQRSTHLDVPELIMEYNRFHDEKGPQETIYTGFCAGSIAN